MFYSLYICFGLIQTVVFYLGVIILCFYGLYVRGGCLGQFSAGGPCVGCFRNLVRGRPIAPWFKAHSCWGGGVV